MIQRIKSSTYTKNFFWLSLDFISKLVIVTFANFFIFNSLTKSDYGIISFLNNIIFLLFPVVSFGSNLTFLKRFSATNDNEFLNIEFSKGFSIRFMISCLTFCILIILYFMNLIELYVFILFLNLCFELLYIYRELFLAKNNNVYQTISNFISDLFFLTAIYFLYKLQLLNIFYLCIVYSVRSLFRLFIYSYYAFFNLKLKLQFVIDFDYFYKIFKESYPLIFSSVASIFTIVLAQFLIKSKIGDNELGIFSASYYLVSLLMTFFSIYSNSLVAYTFKNRKEKKMNSKIIFLIFYSSVIIILFILIFGNKILPYFLSNTFIESIKILFYFSPYILIICFKPIIDKLIVFNGDSDALARRNIFNLFFTSILIYFLLENNFTYKFIPFCFFISELIILASYSLFNRTKYVFMEIKDGIFKFPFK